MISTELIDLLNSGEAVAIVGSGISAGAGLPTWAELFETVSREMATSGWDVSDARAAAKAGDLPEAFEKLSSLTSRRDIHDRIRILIEKCKSPGDHHIRMADWPFKFLVTTNYDQLIELASSGRLATVGNRGGELYKVSAGERGFVWHIHGASGQSEDLSQLVITQSDYEDFYPASNAVERLKAATVSNRCVFLGFSFNDEDFAHVLRTVGRLSNRGKPSFAFIGYRVSQSEISEHGRKMLRDYNVEVIPYRVASRGHEELERLLEAYDPFVVGHSIAQSTARRALPAFDPAATSLRVQSSIDLGQISRDSGLHGTLIGARILAFVRRKPGSLEAEVFSACRADGIEDGDIIKAIGQLRQAGTLTGDAAISLTAKYLEREREARAKVDLARDRFIGSLRARATDGGAELRQAEFVTELVADFLDKLCKESGLGVAQNLATNNARQANLRAAALIKSLPYTLSGVENRDEALLAVKLTVEILTKAREPEAEYLGLLCQGYFGQHLVGASSTLANIDLNFVANTCYILDASVLVFLLAEGTGINRSVKSLLQELIRLGADLATTDMFVDELIEHANWAIRLVEKYGEDSPAVISALRCEGGYKPNQFLNGYYLGGGHFSNFRGYMASMFPAWKSGEISQSDAERCLKGLSVKVMALRDWTGFKDELFVERDRLTNEIIARRKSQGTFRHDRQAQAEAEVALVVSEIRKGGLRFPRSDSSDSFFLSSTRVVDSLPDIAERISLLPEGLAQWVFNSSAISPDYSEMVFEQMMWELAQCGIEFVDRETLLRRFSGVVEASESQLQASVAGRKEYLLERYGPDPESAFSDADPLDIPRLATEVQEEVLRKMEGEVVAAKRREAAAVAAAKMSDKDREELARLKHKQEEKHRRAVQRKRAAQSGKKKK